MFQVDYTRDDAVVLSTKLVQNEDGLGSVDLKSVSVCEAGTTCASVTTLDDSILNMSIEKVG